MFKADKVFGEYQIQYKNTTVTNIRLGTIIEFTSIKPSVSLINIIKAKELIKPIQSI